jgi:hypothetical protein
MSVYATAVNNFIHLLKIQPSLFSLGDKEEITQLIESQPDETTALANAISQWVEQHPNVDQALLQMEAEPVTKSPGSEKPNLNIPPYQIDKQALLNAIHESSSGGNNDEKPGGKVSGNPKK